MFIRDEAAPSSLDSNAFWLTASAPLSTLSLGGQVPPSPPSPAARNRTLCGAENPSWSKRAVHSCRLGLAGGAGLSAKPPGGIDHSAYSKRAMAADQVELMRKLGFDKFCLAGHDRGARVSRRLAKDHPDKVLQLAILDIVPTAYIYSNVTRQVATNLWHWFFLIQPAPLPQLLMGPNADVWVKGMARLLKSPSEREVAYVNAIQNPKAFSAMCEDYRAGASIDLEHDASDAGTLIGCLT